MPSDEEICEQQELLHEYRERLAHEIRRAPRYGGEAMAPSEIDSGLRETRAEIRRIKAWLREHGVTVEDQLNDETNAQSDPPATRRAAGGSVFNFHGPLNVGQANFGGEQTIDQMEVVMGDKGDMMDFSGANFSGATIAGSFNFKSKLEDVVQSVDTLPQNDVVTKHALQQLLTQLAPELEKATQAGHAEDAEKVSSRTKAAVDEAGKPKPDKELIEFNLESLKKAATNIAAVLPTVLPIATQIAEHIHKLVL